LIPLSYFLFSGIVRFTVKESHPLHPRHPILHVLESHSLRLFEQGLIKQIRDEKKIEITWNIQGKGDSYHSPPSSATLLQLPTSHTAKLNIYYNPFSLEFSMNNEIVLLVNSENLMQYEQYRERNPKPLPPFPPVVPEHLPEHTPEQIENSNRLYAEEYDLYNIEKIKYESGDINGQIWPHDSNGEKT